MRSVTRSLWVASVGTALLVGCGGTTNVEGTSQSKEDYIAEVEASDLSQEEKDRRRANYEKRLATEAADAAGR